MNYFYKRIFVNFKNSILYRGTWLEKLYILLISYKLLFLRTFFSRNSAVHCNFFGFKVFSHSYGLIEYLFNEIFVLKEYSFESQTTKPVIIDCGSNIGMSILFFKKIYPGSMVLSFEPNPRTFTFLEQNVIQNKLTNIKLFNVALNDEPGEIILFHDDEPGTLHSSVLETRGGSSRFKVEAKRLSDIVKEFELIDLIKIDVEGAEIEIIEDLMKANLLERINNFIIEYHHNLESDMPGLATFLSVFEQAGFKYNLKAEYKSIRSFQDILIHFYKA